MKLKRNTMASHNNMAPMTADNDDVLDEEISQGKLEMSEDEDDQARIDNFFNQSDHDSSQRSDSSELRQNSSNSSLGIEVEYIQVQPQNMQSSEIIAQSSSQVEDIIGTGIYQAVDGIQQSHS